VTTVAPPPPTHDELEAPIEEARRRARRRRRVLAGAVVALLAVAGIVAGVLWPPGGGSRGERLPKGFRAVQATGPVQHALVEELRPRMTTIALATGRARPTRVTREVWWDARGGLYRILVRNDGVAVSDWVQRSCFGSGSSTRLHRPVAVRPPERGRRLAPEVRPGPPSRNRHVPGAAGRVGRAGHEPRQRTPSAEREPGRVRRRDAPAGGAARHSAPPGPRARPHHRRERGEAAARPRCEAGVVRCARRWGAAELRLARGCVPGRDARRRGGHARSNAALARTDVSRASSRLRADRVGRQRERQGRRRGDGAARALRLRRLPYRRVRRDASALARERAAPWNARQLRRLERRLRP
jgi:hypothetical protein